MRFLFEDHTLRQNFIWTRLSIYWRTLAVLTLLTNSYVRLALAHEGQGINGGQLADNGLTHVEFIGGSGYDFLLFAISDKSQKPIAIEGTVAFAIVELNGKKIQIPLLNQGDSILSSTKGPVPKAGETIWFVARLTSGETLKAKFISK